MCGKPKSEHVDGKYCKRADRAAVAPKAGAAGGIEIVEDDAGDGDPGPGGRPVGDCDDLGEGFEKIKDDTSLVAGGAMAAVGVAAALERVGEGSMTFAGEVAAAARAASEEGKPPPEVLPGADKIRKFFGVDD